MIKSIYILLLACTPLFSTTPTVTEQKDADKDLILGNWKPSNGRSVVQIYKGKADNGEDPNKYYGKIVWLSEPNDENGKPRGQWKADLSFKMHATRKEIQNFINDQIMSDF